MAVITGRSFSRRGDRGASVSFNFVPSTHSLMVGKCQRDVARDVIDFIRRYPSKFTHHTLSDRMRENELDEELAEAFAGEQRSYVDNQGCRKKGIL